MDSAKSTTARLRRTFRYPADHDGDDSDSQPEAMDEQEQEQLIARLAADNAARNTQFRTVLLALPLLALLPYLPPLLRPSAASAALPALLSITSLLSTAFLLHRLPLAATGIAPLDAWSSSSSSSRRGRTIPSVGAPRSPLETYLPYLNAAMALVLALMGLVSGDGEDGFVGVGRANLPGLVYVVVVVGKVVMAGVDPEGELEALKYEYKGA